MLSATQSASVSVVLLECDTKLINACTASTESLILSYIMANAQ